MYTIFKMFKHIFFLQKNNINYIKKELKFILIINFHLN